MATVFNEQAVAANLDFIGRCNRLERTQDRDLDVECQEIRPIDGGKSRIGTASQARTFRDCVSERRIGLQMSNAASKVATLVQADKDAGRAGQRAAGDRLMWRNAGHLRDDGRAGDPQKCLTVGLSHHAVPSTAAR